MPAYGECLVHVSFLNHFYESIYIHVKLCQILCGIILKDVIPTFSKTLKQQVNI